jgi:AraC-like DNA-binding protein
MQEKKPYLKNRYSIRSLAQDINVHAYQLSAYFSQEEHVRFNDYVNRFRIRYCESLIQKGMVNDLNMKGLALVCGFQNRNTLTSAFKKFTGCTPSVYTKQVRTNACR